MNIPNDLKVKMIEKLQTYEYGYDEDEAIELISKRTKYIPDECLPNFYEWIENKEISDVKIKGLSIRDIMYSYAHMNYIEDFIVSTKYFNDYCKEGCTNKDAYLQMFLPFFIV